MMKKKICAFLLILSLLSCSSTQFLSVEDFDREWIEGRLQGKSATIKFKNGQWAKAEIRSIDKNTLVYCKHDSTENTTAPFQDVQMIRTTNHSIGFWQGMVIGFLGGAALGGIVASTGGDEYGDWWWKTNEGTAGIYIMVISPIIGGIIGGVKGAKEIYLFVEDSVYDGNKKGHLQELSNVDKSSVRVEFTKIVEKGRGYIIILWQKKEIRLLSSEYNYMLETEEGKQSIVVPKYIYDSKFK